MNKKCAKKRRVLKLGQATISSLKRGDDGHGDYRAFIEEMWQDMKDRKLTRAEKWKDLNKESGHTFVCHSQFYKICAAMKADPKTAIRDLRCLNGRPRIKLTDSEEYAMTLVLAYYRSYGSGFPDAIETLKRYAGDCGLEDKDFPTHWRCYTRWNKLSTIEKYALEDNFREVFEKLGLWTHNPKRAPDEEHNFDEGQKSVKFAVLDREKHKIQIAFSIQVDSGTWIMRMPHFIFGSFNERESILALKKALLPAPEIGLTNGCLPEQIRCDNATYHRGLSFPLADQWMRNRSGRHGRLIYIPKKQPRANPSAERAVGEVKRKFLRTFLKDFIKFLKEDKTHKRPDQPGAVAHLEDIGRLMVEFVRRHNQRAGKGETIPRIQRYNQGVSPESTSITVEEIDQNVLFVQKMRIEGSGVEVDGQFYDGDFPTRYRLRDDTYVGVRPEGDSPFAVLFTFDPITKNFVKVHDLVRSKLSPKLSLKKQRAYLKEFAVINKKNNAEVKVLESLLTKAKIKEREEAEKNKPPKPEVQISESVETKTETPDVQPSIKPQLPVRPKVEILKAA